jgi:hypothetical protein
LAWPRSYLRWFQSSTTWICWGWVNFLLA